MWSWFSLDGEAADERERTDALAGEGEDGIGERGGDGRDPRLADARRRRVVLDDVDVDDARRFADAHEPEVAKIGLLDGAVPGRDLLVHGIRQPENDRPFE